MKTISEVHREFDLQFSTRPNVLTDIARDRIWTLFESTLTEFIEALDLVEVNNPAYNSDDYDGGYNTCIVCKKAVVDKFMKGQDEKRN